MLLNITLSSYIDYFSIFHYIINPLSIKPLAVYTLKCHLCDSELIAKFNEMVLWYYGKWNMAIDGMQLLSLSTEPISHPLLNNKW